MGPSISTGKESREKERINQESELIDLFGNKHVANNK